MTTTKEKPILFSGDMVRAILDGRKTKTRRLVKPQPWGEYDKLCGPEYYEPVVVDRDGEERDGPTILGVYSEDGEYGVKCPYEVGMRLWVRETWLELRRGHWHDTTQPRDYLDTSTGRPRRNSVAYKADSSGSDSVRCRLELGYKRWRPSIHMPRWASRITLEVTDIRVQRVQEISEADALAEGCEPIVYEDWWQGYRDIGTGDLVHCSSGLYSDPPPEWMIEPRRLRMSQINRSSVEAFRHLWNSINTKPGTRWEDNPWVWAYTFVRV